MKVFRGTLRNRKTADLQADRDAAGGDRTHDLRIKSPLLCQLSYGGVASMIAYRVHPAPGRVNFGAGAHIYAASAPKFRRGATGSPASQS
jgi:hypothetical protein